MLWRFSPRRYFSVQRNQEIILSSRGRGGQVSVVPISMSRFGLAIDKQFLPL